jgi:hypothetical protein
VSRVDEFLGLHAPRRRERRQTTAANISATKVAGSGTVAFTLIPEPLPVVRPKWAREAL